MRSIFAMLAIALCAGPALAQHHGAAHGHAAPYAGFERREIKALSDQQVADLRAGRGMTLAQAAELNGYPGPLHVLELAKDLDLTPEQRARTQSLFDSMKRSATEMGARVIERERALDALFAQKTATAASLSSAAAESARVQGELRALHLQYHVAMRELLTPRQVARYNELRGYASK